MFDHQTAAEALGLALEAADHGLYELVERMQDEAPPEGAWVGGTLHHMLTLSSVIGMHAVGGDTLTMAVGGRLRDQLADLQPSRVIALLIALDYTHCQLTAMLAILADGNLYAKTLNDAVTAHYEASTTTATAIGGMTAHRHAVTTF
jgi:hypothetical protein